jgi:hypothetical protein
MEDRRLIIASSFESLGFDRRVMWTLPLTLPGCSERDELEHSGRSRSRPCASKGTGGGQNAGTQRAFRLALCAPFLNYPLSCRPLRAQRTETERRVSRGPGGRVVVEQNGCLKHARRVGTILLVGKLDQLVPASNARSGVRKFVYVERRLDHPTSRFRCSPYRPGSSPALERPENLGNGSPAHPTGPANQRCGRNEDAGETRTRAKRGRGRNEDAGETRTRAKRGRGRNEDAGETRTRAKRGRSLLFPAPSHPMGVRQTVEVIRELAVGRRQDDEVPVV